MVDPANEPAPRQFRCPAGPASAAIPLDPAPKPLLSQGTRGGIAHGSKIIQPVKTIELERTVGVGSRQIPQVRPLFFKQMPGEQKIARHELAPARKAADCSRLGAGNKSHGARTHATGLGSVPFIEPMNLFGRKTGRIGHLDLCLMRSHGALRDNNPRAAQSHRSFPIVRGIYPKRLCKAAM